MDRGIREPRWRLAQRLHRGRRRRPRRLTARGRATLWAVCLAPVGLCAAGLMAGSGRGEAPGEAPLAGAPAAPAALVAPAPAPDAAGAAPTWLLTRLPVGRDALELPSTSDLEAAAGDSGHVPGLLYEQSGPVRVEYTFDAELTEQVFRTLRRSRVDLGHVVVMDPESGRLLAYASTDLRRFPPTQPYPAASLVKVITAAAALEAAPDAARLPCRFRGSPYRLTAARLDPPVPGAGNEISLERALATSNNQCFAQLAVHAVGEDALLDAIARFGWLAEPAPAHEAGSADPGEDREGLGRLGCGLSGGRITPLHAVQTAAALARGEVVPARWIHRVVDAGGHELRLPALPGRRQAMSPELAGELRQMLVSTTRSGTARRAFRKRGGSPLLGPVSVAGKTGSLSGKEPRGRYEWFIGVAPAEEPRVAVAVLVVQGRLWWRTASQVAAEVLEGVFCERGRCRAEAADRWLRPRGREEVPARTAARAARPGGDLL